MAQKARKTASNIFVWLILGLLFIALAGFGIGNFSGGSSRVGSVGDTDITTDDYFRALQQEIQSRSAQTGTAVSLRDLMVQGIDRAVLRGQVARAALTNEATAMGLSISDASVAQEIANAPIFQAADGSFDRGAYDFYLSRQGLNARAFEETMRQDTARGLLQLAVVGGLAPDPTLTDLLIAHRTETRDFALLRLTEDDLPEAIATPTDEDLQTYYDADPNRFLRPETKTITYAWLTPDMIMDDMTIEDDVLRALYADRSDEYTQPERRLLERLVFFDMAEAQAAYDAIMNGETDFDALTTERGLTFDEVDLGEISFDDLPNETATAIFSDTDVEIFGPLPSNLGPAIFRVNAVLAASEIPFEEAREDLRAELAADAARREINDLRENLEDLLASGATLEDLTAETDMSLGSLSYSRQSQDPITAYEAFRDAADAANATDFPEIFELSDGGLFALRVDDIVPPTVPPLSDIEDEVTLAWRGSELRRALVDYAQTVIAAIELGTNTLDDFGPLESETDIRRQDFLPAAPPTLVSQVFAMTDMGDHITVPGASAVMIARLDSINPGNRNDPDVEILFDFVAEALIQSMAQDIFESYGQGLEEQAGIFLNQSAINAVHAQFP
jgi:peptidyl-prolyl cis-trans isomerase D